MYKATGISAIRHSWIASVALGAAAFGCGGGGGTNTPGPGGPTSPTRSNLAPISVSYVGHPQGVVQGANGQVSVIGQAEPRSPRLPISTDSNKGLVDFIAPAVKGHSAPSVARAGAAHMLTGSFAAVYDAKGVNQAPNGASKITFDPKSGKLISLR